MLERLGAGGFGEVYKAERRQPMLQTVAIKLVKLGLDTREILARFESERQALARMDHPHIARVFDAGVTESGRPYFVMEYVAGVPITRFCDDNKLAIRDRLLLFSQACSAIAHAHAKAVIHRDIKSSNVLAYLQEGKPTVKVIDFGIAKAMTSDRLTDRTFNTERGRVVGTWETMSPEQADGSPDIDERTDVYALGVLLYELLTGAKPFDQATLARAAEEEIRRIIREVDPPRPSTRLSGLGESASKIATLRRAQLDALAKELRSELEWIPLKAMRKERDRRYATVDLICQDIGNYLEHRPLLAGPESRAYRARKFIQRHRWPVAAAVILLLTLTITAGSLLHSLSDRRQRQRVEHQHQRAQRELERIQHELERIRAQAKQQEYSSVRPPDPTSPPGVPLVKTLAISEQTISDELLLSDAIEATRQELGADAPETLNLMHNLAVLLRGRGELARSEQLNRQNPRLPSSPPGRRASRHAVLAQQPRRGTAG